jgi:hypothetical protein
MARVVHKYEVLARNGFGKVEMPVGAEIVHADVQRTSVYIWALGDPDAELVTRLLGYFGTGHLIPDQAEYVGSCTDRDFGLVWHVFEGMA